MPRKKIEIYNKEQLIYPFIEIDHVSLSNGLGINKMLDQNISMLTVTHDTTAIKVGVGDSDVSSSIVDSSVSKMVIKGQTYQNILPEPVGSTKTTYKVNLMKPNTIYTMKVETIKGTDSFSIDGVKYPMKRNATFTSPSSLTDKLLVVGREFVDGFMILEGDLTNKDIPYFKGVKSAFEGEEKIEILSQKDKLSNTTKILLLSPLRSLSNEVYDEVILERKSNKAKIVQRVEVVNEMLNQLEPPIISKVDLEGFPYIHKDGHITLNSEIAPTTEVTYSINQHQQITSTNEDIIRHEKELTYLQKLIAQYVQVDYESVLLSLKV